MATDNTVLRDYEGATAFSVNASLAERAIEPALVMFEKTIEVQPGSSCSLDGVHSQHFFGTGIILRAWDLLWWTKTLLPFLHLMLCCRLLLFQSRFLERWFFFILFTTML
ncbi:BnaC05g48260D [Brassica napus]|uniref:BnaC05g48260D protein n=1 Tax=Brassica napus TaxID=3708 RepID=A0A078I288_BRANA|nr:BnaC05g48260D [Brassica napus]